MEQLIVENIQPVIGKIIELIILLSQIDVIRIRLRAPFEKESEEGYTNQGSGHFDQDLYPCLYLVLFESSKWNSVFRLGWIYELDLQAYHNCTFLSRELEPYWIGQWNHGELWYTLFNHMIWEDKLLTYHFDKLSKEKSLDKVLQVLFHPCAEQKLNHLIDWLPWLEFARKYVVNMDYRWLLSSDCHFHSAWWFSKI